MDDRKKFEKIDLIVRVSFVVISLEVDWDELDNFKGAFNENQRFSMTI